MDSRAQKPQPRAPTQQSLKKPVTQSQVATQLKQEILKQETTEFNENYLKIQAEIKAYKEMILEQQRAMIEQQARSENLKLLETQKKSAQEQFEQQRNQMREFVL